VAARRSFHLPESRPHYPPQKEFRTRHVRIELSIDFEGRSIEGTCTLDLDPVREDLAKITLDAGEFDVRACKVDGQPAEFDYDGAKLTIKARPKGGTRNVIVDYRAVPREGLYFSSPDAEHPGKEVQAWTHSEPESAHFWFPCHDHPSDKATSETVITVPKGFRVISNGKLISAADRGETSTYHWREDVPHSTYLTSFVAGKFGEITQEADGVSLRYNFPESKRGDVLRYFGETPKIIKVLGELTGMRYPYEKYDQTTVQDFIAGGEENINATTLAMNYYPEPGSEEDFQPSYGTPFNNNVNLVAHEAAHQWFGDLVTCSDWCHAWINEAFATYLQSLYTERSEGADCMRWEMRAREGEYFDEDDKQYRRAIVDRNYVWPHDVFDHTTYRKGAAMLHELRYLMGDGEFFRGIAEFLKTHARGCADTDDFRKSMEKTSGQALEEFIDQAFLKPGYPEFRAEYSWDEDAKSATLRVKQTQDTSDGTPVFKLPCDIVFYVGGRRRKFRVLLDAGDQTFVFPLEARPSVVEFDPERWLLKKLKFEKSLDLLVNQLEQSQDAYSRSEAATALGRFASDRAVTALKEAALREQFWDVQACALRALGEMGGDKSLDALLEIGLPKNRRVRRGMAKALGSFRDERARKVLLELLHGDESPYVRCEAALGLAKAWPEGALPHLEEAMATHSPNETLAEACLEAMGKLKDPRAKKTIDESLAYGKPTRVRIGALKAIKARGRIDEDELPVIKEILQLDKEFRVRQYALNVLVKELADTRLVGTLEGVSKKDRNSAIRRSALEAYHELSGDLGGPTTISRLRDEVEELKEENKRLLGASQG